MRQLSIVDMDQAVSVLLAADPNSWNDLSLQILWQAKWADKYRKRTGKRHPVWGNGTVHDVCIRYPRYRSNYPTPDQYFQAMTQFLRTYVDGRHQKN